MTEQVINTEQVNPIEFFGVNNGRFDVLKKRFPLLKILARGSLIKIAGQPDEVERALDKIKFILREIDKLGHISAEYYERIIGEIDANPNEEFSKKDEQDSNDILVFGTNGKIIRSKTKNQKLLVAAVDRNDIIFAIGPAGTGKTYTAVALAVRALKNKSVKKIILTRPAVEAGESLGFLPGDLKEKIDPYLRPLYDALDDMIAPDKLAYYMQNRIIEIAPLAYMRGRTLDNSYIILDEAQNSTDMQMKMFLTRIGPNAKAIITGDMTQVDLPKNQKSGLAKAARILKNIDGISLIELDGEDVVRHRLVKKIIVAYEKESIREEELEEQRIKERNEKKQAAFQKITDTKSTS